MERLQEEQQRQLEDFEAKFAALDQGLKLIKQDKSSAIPQGLVDMGKESPAESTGKRQRNSVKRSDRMLDTTHS